MRLVSAGVALLLAAGCRPAAEPSGPAPAAAGPPPLRVAHAPAPVLAPLYAADARRDADRPPWERLQVKTGGDVGYALLAGEAEAGFLETAKALALLASKGGEAFAVAGAISFPYGATLVVRKDLRVRLGELAGRTVAASEPGCKLLHQFRADARRHGLDPSRVKIVYLPFADMLPALEAKAVDGAVVKGADALLAELAGHKTLYQNWDVKAGDDCCPELLAQLESLLVVRRDAAARVSPLVASLRAASDEPPSALREAVAARVGYPPEAIARFPVGAFVPAGEELTRALGGKARLLP